MNELEQNMTRYLLGELSAAEQVLLEERYFTDPQVFDQVVQVENELVDAYVREQLPPTVRAQFEQCYLSHPTRRERVKFAEALATKIDRQEETASTAAPTIEAISWWRKIFPSWNGQRWRLAAVAVASLLIMLGGIWLVVTTTRLRQELQETQAQRQREEQRQSELEQRDRESQQRQRELEQQVAGERERAEAAAAELERLRAQQQNPQLKPTPTVSSAPAFVSLVLAVGGVRGADTGSPATLVIPSGTQQVRLQLSLKERNYPSYQAVLQAVGGPEIFSRQGLKPKAASSGAGFVLTVPAGKFANGEYILTLRGRSQDGEIDDLSKSLFRVEKR